MKDAIANMALENFDEMMAKTADPQFLLEKDIENELAQKFSAYVSRYAGARAPRPITCTAASFGYFGRDDAALPARHDLFDGKHTFVTMISPCPAKGMSVFMGLARRHPSVRFAAIATNRAGKG